MKKYEDVAFQTWFFAYKTGVGWVLDILILLGSSLGSTKFGFVSTSGLNLCSYKISDIRVTSGWPKNTLGLGFDPTQL